MSEYIGAVVNMIAGAGAHSHEVPTVPGLVVLIRDAHHEGTSIWLRPDRQPGERRAYAFADHERGTISYAPRVILVRGWSEEDLPADGTPYGLDWDSPDGLVLVGVDNDVEIDADWLGEGEVLWDSARGEVQS
jgi:hypothetical protein